MRKRWATSIRSSLTPVSLESADYLGQNLTVLLAIADFVGPVIDTPAEEVRRHYEVCFITDAL